MQESWPSQLSQHQMQHSGLPIGGWGHPSKIAHPSEASSASSSSAVICQDGADGSGPSLKEHDYIGISEVCSSSSSCSLIHASASLSGLDPSGLNLELGLGPVKDCSRTKGLEVKETTDSARVATGASKNGMKRIFSEAMMENALYAPEVKDAIAGASTYAHHLQQTPISKNNSLGSKGSDSYWRKDSLITHCNEAVDTSEPPPAKDQVVGWPPVRSYRKNTLAAHARPDGGEGGGSRPTVYVKVNMDGTPIGRKVDLRAHSTYEGLLFSLQEMFGSSTSGFSPRFLEGSEFTLTYEDKDGDWMLVGDVPWGMFVNTVRRFRIMRGSDAIGLGK